MKIKKCECCEERMPKEPFNRWVCSRDCYNVLMREESMLSPTNNYSPSLQDNGVELGSYTS